MVIKNKVLCITAAVIVFAVIAGGIYWYMQNQNSHINSSQLGTQNLNTSANSNTQTGAGTQINPANPGSTLSYASAIKIYNNRRIQFSVNSSNYCSMIPSYNIAFKMGTNIMLDNRSNKPMTIFLDKQPYYLKTYGFKIVALTTSAKLPHTVEVDCNTGKNNGSIILR